MTARNPQPDPDPARAAELRTLLGRIRDGDESAARRAARPLSRPRSAWSYGASYPGC